MLELVETYGPTIVAVGSIILNVILWFKKRITSKEFSDIADQILAFNDDASDGGTTTTFEEGLKASVSIVKALSSENKT